MGGREDDAVLCAGELVGESGRGLLLVGEPADKWCVGERDPGKAVWCDLTRPASARCP
ncbi:hypothetical protein GCM10010129_27440 [Streptomyces fumigatiscleroticus]|nr:hypothetical protein GCM10010129_27440 [Streptomyces fumigatiscleroticus]